MEPETPEASQRHYEAAIERLAPLGFAPMGNWRFSKDGVTYDLSAANLDMIDYIVREGQCVVREQDDETIQAKFTISEDFTEEMLEGLNDRWLRDKLRNGKSRGDFATVAMNIAEDRHSAGSTAARAALFLLFECGLDAAVAFTKDLEHHEL